MLIINFHDVNYMVINWCTSINLFFSSVLFPFTLYYYFEYYSLAISSHFSMFQISMVKKQKKFKPVSRTS